jgi:hypothetical protein
VKKKKKKVLDFSSPFEKRAAGECVVEGFLRSCSPHSHILAAQLVSEMLEMATAMHSEMATEMNSEITAVEIGR